ncbi:MAG TPA: hypothetical protein VFU86_00110 [Terriglobales bacterium]|nr:hypothetical protein [Terriglobales bacterium]
MVKRAFSFVPILLLATMASAQQIQVRINSRLSSESTRPGTAFDGVLMNAVRLGGQDCAKGSPVGGVVSEAKPSGRLSSPGKLVLQPTWVACHGRRVGVSAEPIVLEGRSHTKKNAVLIGGGAGAGAILGGIAGGGKGAAIGAIVGAGAGTVGAAATGRHEAVIEPEAVVAWNVQQRAPVAARDDRSHRDYADNRRHDDDDYRDRRDDRRYRDDDRDRDDERDYRNVRFSDHDRAYLSRCLVSNYRLPPGLAKQGKIPPGHARKMAEAGYAPIPYACTSELSPIPTGWERVILDARVILFDASHREVDSFVWQRRDDD